MPKKIALFLLLFAVVVGCKQEDGTTGDITDSTDVVELQNRIEQLELDNALKDSIVNESLAFFNEVRANLEAIGIRRDEIKVLSGDAEISGDDKEWILEQIRQINFLREDNARKVKQLNEQINNSNIQIRELEVMVESLMKEIQWKDDQIKMLEEELNQLDAEYAKLFDAYQEQAIEIDALTADLNTVYYAYGTAKELKNNGVIEKKNGFLGMGKKMHLKDEINDDYFTRIDAKKNKVIKIAGKDVHFVTVHPPSSYTLTEEGSQTRIQINDPSEFWKMSKYLVVVVN